MTVDSQSDELQEALKHLSSLKANEHWFCQPKNVIYARTALHLFSYPESDALKWLKKSSILQLTSCHLCSKEYHNSKRELRRDMGGYEDGGIEEFFKRLYDFDVSRLKSSLEESCAAIELNPKLKSSEIPLQSHVAMFECIYAPVLLHDNSLFESFKKVFLGVQANGGFLRVELVPGVLTFLFSDNPGLRGWAEKSLRKQAHKITSKEFHSLFRYEFEETKRTLTRPMVNYEWRALSILLKALDKNAILSGICGEGFDIVKFVHSNLWSQDSSILEILQAFSTLLSTLGSEFWVRLMPLTCANIIDQIMLKLKDPIEHPEILRDDELTESFGWVKPLLYSQNGHSKPKVAQKLCHYFFDQWQTQYIPGISKQVALSFGLSTLKTMLDETSQSNYIDASPDRLLRKEIRGVVDVYQDFVLCNLDHPDSIAIIGLCIEIDANQVKQDYLENASDLWDYSQTISVLPQIRNTNLYKTIIANLLPSVMVDLLPENPPYTAGLQKFRNEISGLFQQLSLLDQTELNFLLRDEKTQKTMIAFLLSPCTEWTQAAIDIIKQAFDATSRAEGVKGLIQLDPNLSIRNISNALEKVGELKSLLSARRAVRFGGDFLTHMVADRGGILKNSNIKLDRLVIQLFWKSYWGVLIHGIANATSWSEKEDKYQLIEFMRSLTDVATELIESHHLFESAISGEVISSPLRPSGIKSELLGIAMQALPYLVVWLRLNDKQLLTTTVSLICRMLRKFVRAAVEVPKEILQDLEKSTTSKKRLILDDQMREDIWIALSEHEDEARMLVEGTAEKSTAPIPSTSMPTGKIDFVKWKNYSKKSKAPMTELGPSWKENAIIIDDDTALSQIKEHVPMVMDPPKVYVRSTNPAKSRSAQKSSVKTASSSKSSSAMQQLRGDFSKDRKTLSKPIKISDKKPRLLGQSDIVGKDSAGTISTSDNSSSEESSDDESDSNGLFSLAKTHKTPPKIRRTERREIKILEGTSDMSGVRRAETERQRRIKAEQHAKARLTPDLAPLHKIILSWSPHHEGPLPPDAKESDYLKVSNKFNSAERYAQTFQPLLMLEAWQQIVRAKEECGTEIFKLKVEGRSSVDEMVEIQGNVDHETFRSHKLGDTDVIVLSNSANPFDQGPANFSFMAKVHGVLRKKDTVEISVRCVPPYTVIQQLRTRIEYFAVKLIGLTPIHREYSALKGLAYYDLCDDIVCGRPCIIQNPLPQIIRETMSAYNLNEPQAKAVAAAQNVEGFSLIQGPPGTGKTKTILGMVGAFLTDQRNKPVQIARPGMTMIKLNPAKILLCAPSNAAVDEILLRLKGGILDAKGEKWSPKVVRIGHSDMVNVAVKDMTLEELVDRAMGNLQSSNVDPSAIREMLNKILQERDSLKHEADQLRQNNQDTSALEEKIRSLNQKKLKIGQELDDARDKQNTDNRRRDFQRRSLQMEILNNAEVICCTLSGSGHEMLTSMAVNFETVIIDEAAQCIELSALIPLKYGCKRCILVGGLLFLKYHTEDVDPNQLPPTVLSQAAAGYAYEQSLFVRMQANHPQLVHLLSIQYRMHPEISLFPSRQFYNSKLLDGSNVAIDTKRPWHKSSLFTEYRFFDVGGREEVGKTRSVMNRMEINVAIQLYDRLQADFPKFDGKIGIVTPYKQQWRELKRQFQNKYGGMIFNSVDFNTVDGFQGQEKDIIIFSCVRASEGTGIGFLADVRRMNVALTRAKSSLFILGNVNSLEGNSYWRALIRDARERNLITRWNPGLFRNRIKPRENHYQDKEFKKSNDLIITAENHHVYQPQLNLVNRHSESLASLTAQPGLSGSISAQKPSNSSSVREAPIKISRAEDCAIRRANVTKKRIAEQPTEDPIKSRPLKQSKKEDLQSANSKKISEFPNGDKETPPLNESPKPPIVLVKRPKKEVDIFIRRKPGQAR
ncbi:putative ATP-dependent helicase [Neolecta irregularis DAH-3]|uniref:Putative ATP-dependent helicase n=1 Tax=Neolecta irregularis (strain DAH-3) TaxID=1198029 RepID=A0A1U7LW95_NEOID|nr:putative ATP-dependent helicase [Neolecta irregularis DAH-3]|eukprot:OLL26822.1 putative ATP-dependent helicase [Neolecta irregularis DAH-3]